jgi:hypothetical protein
LGPLLFPQNILIFLSCYSLLESLICYTYGDCHLHTSMHFLFTFMSLRTYLMDQCGLDIWKPYDHQHQYLRGVHLIPPQVKETCGKYWWTNIIYVNNFIPSVWREQCFLWGWYLAVDMQLCIHFLSSPSITTLIEHIYRGANSVLYLLQEQSCRLGSSIGSYCGDNHC